MGGGSRRSAAGSSEATVPTSSQCHWSSWPRAHARTSIGVTIGGEVTPSAAIVPTELVTSGLIRPSGVGIACSQCSTRPLADEDSGSCAMTRTPHAGCGVRTPSRSAASAGSVRSSGRTDGTGTTIAVAVAVRAGRGLATATVVSPSHGLMTATTSASTTPRAPRRIGSGRRLRPGGRRATGSKSTEVRRSSAVIATPGRQPASGTIRPSASIVAWRRSRLSSAPGTWSRAW